MATTIKWMKLASNIAGGVLGFIFAALALAFLLKLMPSPPPPPEGTPPAFFMKAFGSTGYLTFIQVFEIIGGVLVAIPKTRNFGLLVLGPIIVNILAFHTLVMKGEGLLAPPVILVCLLGAFLLWVERKPFANLLK